MAIPTDRPTRSRSGAAAALAAGSVLTGLLAYVFFAIANRELGASAAAPVAVLWSYWGFAAAGLTFPIQHWVARSVTAQSASGETEVAASARRLLLTVGVVSVLVVLVAWAASNPLFGQSGLRYPLAAGGITAGSGLMGWVRGLLSARRRFRDVAGLLVAENAVRVVVALVLSLTGTQDAFWYALALLAGYLACAGWPSAWMARAGADRERAAAPLSMLGGAAGGQLLAQVVLLGGPVLLALAGGAPAQTTALFAGLALYRIPYTLLLGQVAQLTPWLTEIVLSGQEGRVRRIATTFFAGALVVAGIAAAIGQFFGPWLVALIFGAVPLAASVSVPLAIGSALALGNLLLGVVLLARGRTRWIGLTWLVAILFGVVFFVASRGVERELAVAWWFCGVEAVALVGLFVNARRA